jgi:hypothetical protein
VPRGSERCSPREKGGEHENELLLTRGLPSSLWCSVANALGKKEWELHLSPFR